MKVHMTYDNRDGISIGVGHIRCGLAILGGFALLFGGLNSFTIVQPTEIGVIQTLGRVDENRVLEEGVHLKLPFISTVRKYQANIQEPLLPIEGATKDLQDLKGSVRVYYRIDAANLVKIRRQIGPMESIDSKVAALSQEAFKASSARVTAEESVTKRMELKQAFDALLKIRLETFGIQFVDSSIVNIAFSPKFSEAVEAKQVAQQQAQQAAYRALEAKEEANAAINRARGQAEAQRIIAQALKADGGDLVLRDKAIEAWKSGGAQVPKVLVQGDGNGGTPPFIFNLEDDEKTK
jgi:regulator of protease activity HflC (stomatin/prohibitin superfamily)